MWKEELIRHVYLIALSFNPQPASFTLHPLTKVVIWGSVGLVSCHRKAVVGTEQGKNGPENLRID